MSLHDMFNIGLMQGFAGLSLFSVLLLMGLGLAIIFGQMGVINMAHGEFMIVGAYTDLHRSTLGRALRAGPGSRLFSVCDDPGLRRLRCWAGWSGRWSATLQTAARHFAGHLGSVAEACSRSFRSTFGPNEVSVEMPSG